MIDLYFLKAAKKLDTPSKSNILEGIIVPETEEDIINLKQCKSVEGEYTLTIDDDIKIGKEVAFTFSPFLNFGYAGYNDLLENRSLSDSNLFELLKNSFFHQWAKDKSDPRQLNEENAQSVFSFITTLTKFGYIQKNSIIFFNKYALEIPLKLTKSDASDLIDMIKTIKPEQTQLLQNLCLWLNDDDGKHSDEKRQILSTTLFAYFTDEPRLKIIDIFKKISEIDKEVRGQYSLYLENFRYEKFVKKLEENNEKFVSKINETLGKVFSQILGLPIAATALSVFSKEQSYVGYIGLFIYCILCFVALINQTQILQFLKDDLNNFEKNGNIPNALKEQWSTKVAQANRLFKMQYTLAFLMCITIASCLFYATFSLIQITLN